MNILFIHQNFPGQFKHLAPALVARGHNVTAMGITIDKGTGADFNGMNVVQYGVARGSSTSIHPWVLDYETKIIRAEACSLAAQRLRDGGLNPEVIVAHSGWGETLFIKEIWPEAKLLMYSEFYYRNDDQDVDFDPEFAKSSLENRCRVALKNTNSLLHFEIADAGLSPTEWQASTYPDEFRRRISVIFDGIDTDDVKPNPDAALLSERKVAITTSDEVITFVNRSLEPYRGYHIFMRALPELLKTRPNAKILIIGRDGVSYGAPPEEGTWKQIFIDEVKADISSEDMKRVHFLGNVPYHVFKTVMQVSSLHVYLTYPFVLSWSLLEAMSTECCILASDTAPVSEVISHGQNGVLIDFFDVGAIVKEANRLLDDDGVRKALGTRARETIIKNYDLHSVCLPKQIKLVEGLSDKKVVT